MKANRPGSPKNKARAGRGNGLPKRKSVNQQYTARDRLLSGKADVRRRSLAALNRAIARAAATRAVADAAALAMIALVEAKS